MANVTDHPLVAVFLAERAVKSAGGALGMARRWNDRHPVAPDELARLETNLTAARENLLKAKLAAL
jgi:hypothetical protein